MCAVCSVATYVLRCPPVVQLPPVVHRLLVVQFFQVKRPQSAGKEKVRTDARNGQEVGAWWRGREAQEDDSSRPFDSVWAGLSQKWFCKALLWHALGWKGSVSLALVFAGDSLCCNGLFCNGLCCHGLCCHGTLLSRDFAVTDSYFQSECDGMDFFSR